MPLECLCLPVDCSVKSATQIGGRQFLKGGGDICDDVGCDFGGMLMVLAAATQPAFPRRRTSRA
jgi:hypothetical protein